MSDFQRLEAALRQHGFLVGVLTETDRDNIGKLLKDIWKFADPDHPPTVE